MYGWSLETLEGKRFLKRRSIMVKYQREDAGKDSLYEISKGKVLTENEKENSEKELKEDEEAF